MTNQHARPRARLHVAVMAVMVVATAVVGYQSYATQRQLLATATSEQLNQIAEVKASQVSAWRLERLGDATVAVADAALMPSVRQVLTDTESTDTKQRVQAWLDAFRANYQYANVVLLDPGGRIRLASGQLLGPSSLYRNLAVEVGQTDGVMFRDVPLAAGAIKPHFTLGVGLKTEDDHVLGTLLLGVDPTVSLDPAILNWPTSSSSGEIVLARRDGNAALYLSDLRRTPGSQMARRDNLDRAASPIVQAVLGGERSIDGVNPSGVRVLAAARRVADSPWYVVAALDETEASQPLQQALTRLLVIGGSLLLTCAAGVGLMWRHQLSTFDRQRYEAEVERQALVGHYDFLTRFGNDTILLLDGDGRIIEVNDRAVEWFGYSREEFLGMNIRALKTPATQADFNRRWDALQQQKSLVFETENLRKNGTTFPTEVSVRLMEVEGRQYCQTIIRDISDRKQAESELRASRERLELVLDSTDEGYWDWNPVTGDAHLSPRYYTMLGYLPGEFRFDLTSWLAMTHPDDAARVEEAFKSFLDARQDAFSAEFRMRCKSGQYIWVHSRGKVVTRNDHGLPTRLVGTHRDVTEHKRLEDQFLQAQKLESVGRLAGGIAHDFNNLLMVINGYSDITLSQLEAGDPHRDYLDAIRQSGERAAELTRQLLAFSRRQEIQARSLPLNTVVGEFEQLFRRLVGADIELVTRFRALSDQVLADPSQLHQVVMNLVVNARDAMPDGGRLTIETDETDLSPEEVVHEEVAAGHYVRLSVTDTGTGMDEGTRARIFEPFFTTKERGKGTGLGLSTAYGIVRQSGGFIRVESEPGKGTSFRIYWPRTLAPPAPRTDDVAIPASLRGTETVLIVEDQQAVRDVVVEMLRAFGYCVHGASDGRQALRVASEHAGLIDVLVTDVVMPGLDGKTLAGRLRASCPTLKVIYMSGYSADVLGARGQIDSEITYLQKPFTPQRLMALLREVLDRPAGAPEPPAPRRATVLVVDDEERVRALFLELLGAEYHVLLAADGVEAMDLLRSTRHVDLVLTDLFMPNQEGIETIQAIQELMPSVRIIAMSGAFGGHFLKAAERLGVAATLAKPIRRDVLLATVTAVLNGATRPA